MVVAGSSEIGCGPRAAAVVAIAAAVVAGPVDEAEPDTFEVEGASDELGPPVVALAQPPTTTASATQMPAHLVIRLIRSPVNAPSV